VNECPEKDRDTTQGRATGPTKELLVWAGSVLGPSLSDRKILSDDASWLIIACRNARDGRLCVSSEVVCDDLNVVCSDLNVASIDLCGVDLLEQWDQTTASGGRSRFARESAYPTRGTADAQRATARERDSLAVWWRSSDSAAQLGRTSCWPPWSGAGWSR